MRLYVTLTLALLALWPQLARAQATPSDATPPAPLPQSPELQAHDAALKAQIIKDLQGDTDAKIKKAKDELRDEMRAELVTAGASATPSEFEQLPVEKPKLQFLELNGYFRLRPDLFQDLPLGWTQPDPLGYYLFPKPYANANGKTVESADMRFRVEPTLNVSEDIKIKGQVDVLDNLVLGSTPAGGYGDLAAGGVGAGPQTLFSSNQLPPTSSITAKRVWAEVMTPVGQLRFGRMGSHWGLGLYQNDGNCLDCDYGNTVDRIMFVAKIGGFYLIPMLDFVTAGPLYNPYTNDPLGQPVAVDRALGSYQYGLIFASKDTDEELRKKIDEGKASINYGVYFNYRNQDHDALGLGDSGQLLQNFYAQNGCTGSTCVNAPNTPAYNTNPATPAGVIDARNANFFTPDIWFRYQTKRLRLEAEATYIYGTFDTFWDPGNPSDVSHLIYVSEYGGAAQGEYKFLADGALSVSAEVGLASPGQGPGFGNHPERTGPSGTNGPGATPAGSIDGRQYFCTVGQEACPQNAITNFSFNRDYHVDMILWRELLGGVTSAWYGKPSIKYTITDGLDASTSLIYSQAWYDVNTPGGHLPLGLEWDTGVHYRTDDGFVASLDFGLLGPFAGLGEATTAGTFLNPSVAYAFRFMLGVKY